MLTEEIRTMGNNMLIKDSPVEVTTNEGYFPSISVPGKAIDLSDEKIGSIIELKVKVRVKGMYSDNSGDRYEVEVRNAERA